MKGFAVGLALKRRRKATRKISRDWSLPDQPISIRKAQSRKKSPHTFAHRMNCEKHVSAMCDNHIFVLFCLTE